MKIKALVPFSNGTISMEQYQVAEVTDELGNQLIAAGVAIEIGGGGSGGGVLVVTLDENDTLDKTWQEIYDAFMAGVVRLTVDPTGQNVTVLSVQHDEHEYSVTAADGVGNYGGTFVANSASDYPVVE